MATMAAHLLTLQHFADKVNQAFTVTLGDATVQLTLVRADALPDRGVPYLTRPPFSLLFDGPAGQSLPQRTHTLAHPVLGERAIFLVPLGPNPDGTHRYQAVFN